MGRGFRDKIPFVLLWDFVTHTVVASSPSHSIPSSNCSSGTPYPLTHYINCGNFSVNYRHFLAAIVISEDPKSIQRSHENWWLEKVDEGRNSSLRR